MRGKNNHGKIIIIATPRIEHYTMDYLSRVILPLHMKVTVICLVDDDKEGRLRKNGIRKIVLGLPDRGKWPTYVWNVLQIRSIIIGQFNKVDYLHFQGADYLLMNIMKPFFKRSERVIVSFWGSDLYRVSKRRRQSYRSILKRAQIISLITEEMKQYFLQCYNGEFKEKVYLADFGIKLFDYFDNDYSYEAKTLEKKKWGIDEDDIAIHIGYNGSEAQQHIRIVESLNALDEEKKDRVVVVIHFWDGHRKDEYEGAIRDTLEKKGIRYLFVTDYLDPPQMVAYRRSADIFIYGQTTDALASSLLEYIYAGSVIVKGEWLKYSQLEGNGLIDYSFDDFSRISPIVEQIIDLQMMRAIDIQNRRKALNKLYSWDAKIVEWTSLYRN